MFGVLFGFWGGFFVFYSNWRLMLLTVTASATYYAKAAINVSVCVWLMPPIVMSFVLLLYTDGKVYDLILCIGIF